MQEVTSYVLKLLSLLTFWVTLDMVPELFMCFFICVAGGVTSINKIPATKKMNDQWILQDTGLEKLVDNPTQYCGISEYPIFMWIHMPISYSKSERGSASSSPWVLLCGGTVGVRRWWKWTMTASGAPMMWCSG
jgi:hypothetical protein